MMSNRVEKVVGTMVFCVECRTVIWAHDADHGDVRSICNMFRLACPLCGAAGSFDGFSVCASMLGQHPDAWAKMHAVADAEKLAWRNSPDLTWHEIDTRGVET